MVCFFFSKQRDCFNLKPSRELSQTHSPYWGKMPAWPITGTFEFFDQASKKETISVFCLTFPHVFSIYIVNMNEFRMPNKSCSFKVGKPGNSGVCTSQYYHGGAASLSLRHISGAGTFTLAGSRHCSRVPSCKSICYQRGPAIGTPGIQAVL